MPDRTSGRGVACNQRTHPVNVGALERRFRTGVAGRCGHVVLTSSSCAWFSDRKDEDPVLKVLLRQVSPPVSRRGKPAALHHTTSGFTAPGRRYSLGKCRAAARADPKGWGCVAAGQPAPQA